MKKPRNGGWTGELFSGLILAGVVSVVLVGSVRLGAREESRHNWDLAVLEGLIQRSQQGGAMNAVSAGCMELQGWQLVAFRSQLEKLRMGSSSSSSISPQTVLQDPVELWPDSVVPYRMDASVSESQRRVFLAAAADLQTFARVRFVPRNTEVDYILVRNVPGLPGAQSSVGKVGPAQRFDIGEGSWNRWTLIHEMGHALGLVHEHQRPDRDEYLTIRTENIEPGSEAAFVKLPTARPQGDYDFLSVMHYRRDSFSKGEGLDTMVPKDPYARFLNEMGNQYDRPLSGLDRKGLAKLFGTVDLPSLVVSTTADSGPGSLVAAIYRAVDEPGSVIAFDIPTSDPGYDAGSGTWIIRPTDQIPKLGRGTVLDATTQGGGGIGVRGPRVVLDGSYTAVGDVFAHGLKMMEDHCVVKGFAIRNFDGSAIAMAGVNAVSNRVVGCHLGCNAAGTEGSVFGQNGVTIEDGAAWNVIGGRTVAERNIISGNKNIGLQITGERTEHNSIVGNFVGLSLEGSAALPNGWDGMQFTRGAAFNEVESNVISGNAQYGIALWGEGVRGNRVAGNLIGVDALGLEAVANGWTGVGLLDGAKNNWIGGLHVRERNIISGNLNVGVYLSGQGVIGNVVSGNWIGVDITGGVALGNHWSGVQLSGGVKNNLIGGVAPGAGNVVSGNAQYGIILMNPGTEGNVVQGNVVGLDVTGSYAIPNSWSGVAFFLAASSNRLGGVGGGRNVISGNRNHGVVLGDVGTTRNVIEGNTVGLDATGSTPLGNGWDGVIAYGGASSNVFGGLERGAGNRIGGNTFRGMIVQGGETVGNSILGNVIFGNRDMALYLYDGGNRFQPAPSVSSAVVSTGLTVRVSIAGERLASVRVEFFGYATPGIFGQSEASRFLGARNLVTDADGTAVEDVVFSSVLPAGYWVCATATTAEGNTSALSPGVRVEMEDPDLDGLPSEWERLNGLDPNLAVDAERDVDGDGWTAYQEFLMGTLPKSVDRTFGWTGAVGKDREVRLQLEPVTGRVYRVLRGNERGGWDLWMDSLVWEDAVGGGRVDIRLIPGTDEARAFFKLEMEDP